MSELQAEKESLVDQNRKLELSNRFLNTEMKRLKSQSNNLTAEMDRLRFR